MHQSASLAMQSWAAEGRESFSGRWYSPSINFPVGVFSAGALDPIARNVSIFHSPVGAVSASAQSRALPLYGVGGTFSPGSTTSILTHG